MRRGNSPLHFRNDPAKVKRNDAVKRGLKLETYLFINSGIVDIQIIQLHSSSYITRFFAAFISLEA